MGSRSSKANAVPVTTEPPSTTVTVPTTLYTSTADLRASGAKGWIDTHGILYVSLAFMLGILLTVLVFAVIYLIRKQHTRSHENSQEQGPSRTVTEESTKNVQNEVTYTTLAFQQSRTPMAV